MVRNNLVEERCWIGLTHENQKVNIWQLIHCWFWYMLNMQDEMVNGPNFPIRILKQRPLLLLTWVLPKKHVHRTNALLLFVKQNKLLCWWLHCTASLVASSARAQNTHGGRGWVAPGQGPRGVVPPKPARRGFLAARSVADSFLYPQPRGPAPIFRCMLHHCGIMETTSLWKVGKLPLILWRLWKELNWLNLMYFRNWYKVCTHKKKKMVDCFMPLNWN